MPAASWTAGLRYVLKLSGTVYSRDGRELLLSKEIPFYVIAPSPMPYLKSVLPADGASTRVFAEGETVLEFTFSLPMDRRSVETALSSDSMGAITVEWLNNDETLLISAGKTLSPWTNYRWSLSEKALSRDGAPLASPASGRFITDLDENFPKVLKVIPLLAGGSSASWGSWAPFGLDMSNGLGSGQGIGVEFSKPMDRESLKSAFYFQPGLPGRIEQFTLTTAVFIPERDPDPEIMYTLKIGSAVQDTGGLKMGEDYTISFVSDIKYLKILAITPDGSAAITEPGQGSVISAPIVEPDGIVGFTIYFSLPFSDETKVETAMGISMEPFFPGTLPPVNLRFARWLSSDRLRMEWDGLEPGTDEEPHYYRLSLPGGRNGINNGSGSYPETDFYFYFKAAAK
jgi:hypothetical protein